MSHWSHTPCEPVPKSAISISVSFIVRHNEQCYLAKRFHVCRLSRFLPCIIDALFEFYRYNKYTQITARAVRASLKEDKRVGAEKRGLTALKYQHWENGEGGQQVRS